MGVNTVFSYFSSTRTSRLPKADERLRAFRRALWNDRWSNSNLSSMKTLINMHNQTRSLVLSREHYRARSHRSMSEMSKSKSDSPRKRTGSTDQCQCCDSLALPLQLLFSITLKLLRASPSRAREIYVFVYVRFNSSSMVEWWRISDVFGLTKSNAVAGSNTVASFLKRTSFSSDRSSYTRRKHSTSPDSHHLLEMLPLSVSVVVLTFR